uniref:Uncharacterized protein n=1 Tax=Glycine max TaxID=3847 RepID=C6TGE2_SOYBN|nr:unknown [Glycine max]
MLRSSFWSSITGCSSVFLARRYRASRKQIRVLSVNCPITISRSFSMNSSSDDDCSHMPSSLLHSISRQFFDSELLETDFEAGISFCNIPGVLLHWFSGEMLMDLSRFSTSTHGRPSGTESLQLHLFPSLTNSLVKDACPINPDLWEPDNH